MNKVKGILSVTTLALSLIAVIPTMSRADEMAQGGMMMAKDNAPVSISGYCPVCLLSGMKEKGSNNFTTEYKGQVYKFGNIGMQKAFLDNPEKYTKDAEARAAAMSK